MFQSLYQQTLEAAPQAPENASAIQTWPALYTEPFAPINLATYRLQLSGDVATPATFSWEELLALSHKEQKRRVVSSLGWSYKGNWRGIPLKKLCDKVKPNPSATLLCQTNAMGKTRFLPLKKVLESNALLCTHSDEHPLSPLYGGPFRLICFDYFFEHSLPQLTQLEFTSEEALSWAGKDTAKLATETITGQVSPGDYYCLDLKEVRSLQTSGEVTVF